MEKHSISPIGMPESDAEWRTWEEAQRAINNHLGESYEGGRSEYDPSVWMMGKHAPQHEKYNLGDPADPDENEAHPEHEEEWEGSVVCPSCAYYNEYGEGDPDHEEKFDRGMARIYPNRVALACPADRECHERGTCAICGDEINPYEMYGPEGHRAVIIGDSARGAHRIIGSVSRALDTVWR